MTWGLKFKKIYKAVFFNLVMSKNKTFWAVLGVIFLIFGIIGTITIAVKGQEFLQWLFITAASVIAGILLVAWALSD